MPQPNTVDSYFERLDEDRFQPTSHCGGGWDPDELHFSPLAGLIVHAIDRQVARSGTGMLLGRVVFDILGRLPNDVCDLRVETIRPGRTIELLEATLSIRERPAVRARAWMLGEVDTGAVAGGVASAPAAPETLDRWDLSSVWPGGFVASLDVRPVAPPEPGRTTAWLASDRDLVAGEPSSAVASFVALIDTANGIAVRESPQQWMFPNVDLAVHLHRQPQGRWVGLETTVVFGSTGQGVTRTVLHDVVGPVGFAEQLLTVRPAPAEPGITPRRARAVPR